MPAATIDTSTSTTATFIIDETLRVLSADESGREALERGACLRLALGRLCTGSMSLNARLRDGVVAGTAASELRLATDNGDELALSVMPLTALDGSSHQAVVTLRTEHVRADNLAKVVAACGLTVVETEVLRLIYKGLNTVEAASVMGVSKTTVRTHLHHIFEKTETSRQSELVHFVASWQAW
jgi:DNA-binding CsgD family transcriptional regulator